MPCFHPLPAWLGDVGESGKRRLVFKAGESAPGLSVLEQKCPCGQCIGCRLDYALDWAVRCQCEVQMHKQSCFVTLTYEVLPPDGSLQLVHWQNFMKRLRELYGPVRHFHAGEYGEVCEKCSLSEIYCRCGVFNSTVGRPHDHSLLFGLDFPDRKYLFTTKAGSKIYSSDVLTGLWKKATSGLGGFCSIGDANFKSAGYLARYLIGRPTLTRAVRDDNDSVIGRVWSDKALAKYGEKVDPLTGEVSLLRRPEYLTMSRRPGIGRTWFEKFGVPDVYPRDYVLVNNTMKMPPPRYFDTLYGDKNSVDMKRIKIDRISRCDKKEEVWNKCLEKLQWLDVSRDDRLKVMEEVKLAQVSFLKEAL